MDEKPDTKVEVQENGTKESQIPEPPPDRLSMEELLGFWLSLQRKGFTPVMARMTSGTNGEPAAQSICESAVNALGMDANFIKGGILETPATFEPGPQ